MNDQPNNTAILDGIVEPADSRGYALLTATAQQAVLPRKLDEGVYAILDAGGGIQVCETDGYRIERKFEWERARSDKPEFVHRSPTLLDVDSFIDYLARQTDGDSDEYTEVTSEEYSHGSGRLELWASIDDRQIRAILDGYDGLRKHTATLSLRISSEWDEWATIDGKLLPQVEFAGFIQDHISTIGEPAGAVLVDICETLVGSTDVNWKSQSLDANGQRQFVYEEIVNGAAGAKHDLKIPTNLLLVLRPFQGSGPLRVEARFRFRLSGGGVQMGVKLVEPDRILEDAFAAIVEDVQDRVPVHVNLGRG